MKLGEAIEIVEKHNEWRRDRSDTPIEPLPIDYAKNLGIAIDAVVRSAKEHSVVMQVINQISDKPRKTHEQRLANACVKFLSSMR
jgi:hypothetical protein